MWQSFQSIHRCIGTCGSYSQMILSFAKRDVKFLVAAKSTKKPVVGTFCNMLESIPVERPQDLAKKGKGKVVFDDECKLIGKGTEFLK